LAGGKVIMACGNVKYMTRESLKVKQHKIPGYLCLEDPSFPPINSNQLLPEEVMF